MPRVLSPPGEEGLWPSSGTALFSAGMAETRRLEGDTAAAGGLLLAL